MEPFIVSARKYRPQHFEEVVGQQAITQTLLNAIENNHLAQALLFCGPRGVGKTTCARILAKKINEDGSESRDEDFAFNIFELDAASNNSVDDIRSLIDQVRIPPQVGKYKVYIIDEVHMLSQAAFNAFLKTLEEPPGHAIFILATTEKHKIIPTILSRCQIFDFRRITVMDTVSYLSEIAEKQGIQAEEEALQIIAQKADGALRDALSIFDRVVSFAGKTLSRKAVADNLNVLDVEVYFKTTELILKQDIPSLLLHFNRILSQGFEGHHFISGLASHFRDLMVCRNQETIDLLDVSENTKKQYLQQAENTSAEFLIQALDLANQCDLNYKASKNHRLLVELCLMQLASIGSGQKKKSSKGQAPKLIPASHYHNRQASEITVPDPVITPAGTDQGIAEAAQTAAEETKTPVPEKAPAAQTEAEAPAQKKVTINIPGRQTEKVSGLSLSSIRAKKKHQAEKKAALPEEEDLPADNFSEEDLQTNWEQYIAQIENEGRKILASSLATDKPKILPEHTIWIELPNSTMKKEVEREQLGVLTFLREQLNNYHLKLKITVNEEVAKQFAFTPEEKYQKLREKNPAIDLLRKTFDLDL
ncbi:DNA polymerase III subunit gamma/tau [Robiginitalea sp. IMCC44478]|uniref:DNA polymerase III subunit gamma/tau n=1 Tax=Robiginitalea sp. IMCC44478 TaxID=3459122 RepID=UPI0040423414